MSTFWAIIAVLRLAYKLHGATLGWPYADAIVSYLSRYYSSGRHRLRWGHEVAAGRPTHAQAMDPVPRALCWA